LHWKILILLITLAYPLVQIAEVQGAAYAETIRDGIKFAISADGEVSADGTVFKGQSFNITLSVSGAWSAFHGNLTYDLTRISFGPFYDGRYGEWNVRYLISDLGLGLHDFTFEAMYCNTTQTGWFGPAMVILTVEVVQPPVPPPPEKPIYNLKWLSPLSKRDSFKTGSTIPIRFSVHNETADFIPDVSVNVTVTDQDGYVVFSASYGTHEKDVRIRESAEYYIVYWKTPRTPGDFTISVEFQGFYVEPHSLLIELR